ncbi:MAG: LytTR family transcriptional regulator [Muribaculaceae bacterium]|nr:LytTR family transcriptional regulator [Muribaculaceae bacterium]
MSNELKETIKVRALSVSFVVLALAIFKPFGLDSWQWQTYAHLLSIGVLGFCVCMITDVILKYLVGMPRSLKRGASYIIKRNLWFQVINTPLIALMICLYRHFVFSDSIESNRLSWSNFFGTLFIIAFCSFAIGLYWRFKYRSRYLAAELEETRLLNEQLQRLQNKAEQHPVPAKAILASEVGEENQSQNDIAQLPSEIILKGNTSDSVKLPISNLLYVEAVGNYVKVCQVCNGKVHTDMLRATLKQIENDLSNYPMIVRCHRAFLVNLRQVEQIISKAGTMQLLIKHSHEYLPVSRSNMAGVKQAIANHNDRQGAGDEVAYA